MRANRQTTNAAWRRLRAAVLTRDAWTCGDCGKRGGRFEVHHINLDPTDNRLENLVTLDRACHKLRHYGAPPAGRDEWDVYLAALVQPDTHSRIPL
jgi:5-methylcytosine-specific restriction endonuclease McrA